MLPKSPSHLDGLRVRVAAHFRVGPPESLYLSVLSESLHASRYPPRYESLRIPSRSESLRPSRYVRVAVSESPCSPKAHPTSTASGSETLRISESVRPSRYIRVALSESLYASRNPLRRPNVIL